MATKKSNSRRGGGKKSKKDSRSATVTFTISRACAEELYIALGKGGFGPTSEFPGHDDTKGRD
jgi:hypothetical protein